MTGLHEVTGRAGKSVVDFAVLMQNVCFSGDKEKREKNFSVHITLVSSLLFVFPEFSCGDLRHE